MLICTQLHVHSEDLRQSERTRHSTDAHQAIVHLGPALEAGLVFIDPQAIRALSCRLDEAAAAMEDARHAATAAATAMDAALRDALAPE